MNRIRLAFCAAAVAALLFPLAPAPAQELLWPFFNWNQRPLPPAKERQRIERRQPVDEDTDRPRRAHQGTPGEFDFYVLSLSWSPSFCETGGGRRGENEQCGRERPYAFVVHGLWPQYERGFPEYCTEPAPWIENKLIRSMLDLMPAKKLVIHEWQAHGTCSGLDPERYFGTVRSAREKISIPERFVRLDGYTTLAPAEVEDAFVAANPGLAHEMIAVTCSGRYLSEVRICMSKDLGFHACPETDRRACRNQQVVMPPVRGG